MGRLVYEAPTPSYLSRVEGGRKEYREGSDGGGEWSSQGWGVKLAIGNYHGNLGDCVTFA